MGREKLLKSNFAESSCIAVMAQWNSRTLWTQITSTDLLAKSVFYQLFLFVIVTGVLRNYVRWTRANLLSKRSKKERFISVFKNQILFIFDFLGLNRKAKHLRRVLIYSQIYIMLFCVNLRSYCMACSRVRQSQLASDVFFLIDSRITFVC